MLRDLLQVAQDSFQDVLQKMQNCDSIRAPDPARQADAKAAIEELGRLRGRPLIYPMIPSGRGSGPFVELTDGSVKLDMISGIGVFLFGHGHPELLLTSIRHAMRATTMQGTLMPGKEYADVCRLLLKHTARVAHLGPEATSRLAGTWLTSCGTMANELALKILRQKKYPAYKLISFKNCFAGRSTAMQELTDEPKYREGQPTFGQFEHIDFFDEKLSVSDNIARTREALDAILDREPGKFCGMGFEPVQGEGGAFRTAPREWWLATLEHVRERGLGIWFDEVQTFGRTGELFAYQRLGLGDFVDVLTLAKPLHAAAVMWTDEFAPKPGLIAGTFAGSTVALALGAKILEMLTGGDYLGGEGRIQRLERFIKQDWEARKVRIGSKYNLGRMNIYGGMVCFEILDGQADTMRKFLNRLFENGVIGFSAGRDPVMLRFLPPVGVLTEEHWVMAMNVVEKTLGDFAS
jgi:acetylornithine/N-succinyldiaminopimelate aminotransferase